MLRRIREKILTSFNRLKNLGLYIWHNRATRAMIRYFDWPLFLIVLGISLFGIVCIFSATSSEVTSTPSTIMEMLETQSTTYPRLQLFWLGLGLLVMCAVIFLPHLLYKRLSMVIYIANLVLLLGTLVLAKAGRGSMKAFLSWGNDRGLQTSEFGKIAIIISMAASFSALRRPLEHIKDTFSYVLMLLVPVVLVILQPDFGTAMVYMAIFCVLVFISGTNPKLIWGVILVAILFALTYWVYLNTSSSSSFRATRILIWLDPESYPDDARQVINAQIAVGSGGIWGKGIISPGSFASLGYISDDHTDFIFAIVCESFGLVGGFSLVLAYALMLARMIHLALYALRCSERFGAFLIMGCVAMFTFHIVENLCMVIGLLPVTGIPLPFVSYGGSNLLTNLMAIGLTENVTMRTRYAHANVGKTDNKTTPL